MQLHTYLNYGGNCEQAFQFYERNLGGKITFLMRHGEQPGPGNVPADWKGKVLHARMTLGGTELLGADVPADRFQPIRSAYLSLTLDSAERPTASTHCSPTAGRSSCPSPRRSSPPASPCCATASARRGC